MDIYVVKIKPKYLNKIIKYKIYINKIIKKKDYYLLYLTKKEYNKILKYKKIFEIELIDLKGFIKYKKLFFNNIVFFIMFFITIIYLVILSHIIFRIDVKTNNSELKELVIKELKKYDISLYKYSKSFEYKEKIKQEIIKNNKDKIEWLEITKKGTSYIIDVTERIINNESIDNIPVDIVAKKNAIILKIEAEKGSIVKKLNDYVKKGDIIVTGSITHNEEIVDLVHAKATIYGETWYKVHVSYPINYYDKTKTNETGTRLKFNFFSKEFIIGKKFKNYDIRETKLLYNKFLPIKLAIENIQEVVLIDNLYTVDEAYEKALEIARDKLLDELDKDSKILNQKKLKIIVNDSTIDVDIFFKVYENITEMRRIGE